MLDRITSASGVKLDKYGCSTGSTSPRRCRPLRRRATQGVFFDASAAVRSTSPLDGARQNPVPASAILTDHGLFDTAPPGGLRTVPRGEPRDFDLDAPDDLV